MNSVIIENKEKGIVAARCYCSSEMLVFDFIKDDDLLDDEVFVSIYELPKGKIPFKFKLRYIFRILKYGFPYGDQVILDKGIISDLIEKLKEFSE